MTRPEPTYRPRISEWSPERAELTNVVDRLAELVMVLVAVNGGHPRQITPRPRPVTALDRLKERERARVHAGLVARLIRRNR